MTTGEDIGARVRESLQGHTQSALAERVGMTVDAMSRALRGQRGFSSVELADIADVLGVDVYWLITGQQDPLRMQVAARHDYDFATGKHSNPGRSTDQQDLDAVELAYRQAYPEGARELDRLPDNPRAMREALGEGFVPDFAERVEQRLGVDVIRLPLLTTAYSLTLSGRRVIILPTKANWFRSNSDLAHELGHFALRHHDAGFEDPGNEWTANAFAAELLLPEEGMRGLPWATMTGDQAAKFLWESGVSGVYVRMRLSNLGIEASAAAQRVLSGKMPGALRPHMNALGAPLVEHRGPFVMPVDPIDARMAGSAQRRFPLQLIAAHTQAVESRKVNPATLAWMLDCGVSDLFDDMDTAGGEEPGTSASHDDSHAEANTEVITEPSKLEDEEIVASDLGVGSGANDFSDFRRS